MTGSEQYYEFIPSFENSRIVISLVVEPPIFVLVGVACHMATLPQSRGSYASSHESGGKVIALDRQAVAHELQPTTHANGSATRTLPLPVETRHCVQGRREYIVCAVGNVVFPTHVLDDFQTQPRIAGLASGGA